MQECSQSPSGPCAGPQPEPSHLWGARMRGKLDNDTQSISGRRLANNLTDQQGKQGGNTPRARQVASVILGLQHVQHGQVTACWFHSDLQPYAV